MTVSPTIGLAPATQNVLARVARAVVALTAFALLAGVWFAYFTFIPPDFRVR